MTPTSRTIRECRLQAPFRHRGCSNPGCLCGCHDPVNKVCSGCGESKPRTEFNKQSRAFDGLQPACRKCTQARDKKRRESDATKARARETWLMRGFGMSIADYDALLESQDGGCAICGSKDARQHNWGKKGTKSNLAVDHDHGTGEIRGLLCGPCNAALGGFQDSPELLRRAADYLESYRNREIAPLR